MEQNAFLESEERLKHALYLDKRLRTFLARFIFLTASKYCGSGLKIDLVVVVIKLLSKSTAFVSLKVIDIPYFCSMQWKN